MSCRNFKILGLALILSTSLNARAAENVKAPTLSEQASKEAILDSRLDEWLDKLAMAESNNTSDIRILDVNGKYSYGCLMFQMDTFKRFYALISSQDEPESIDYQKDIYDCSIQKNIAKAMLGANNEAWMNWYNSVKKIGLPPR